MSCCELHENEYYSEELITKAQNKDKEAMNLLVQKNMPLVNSLIKKFYFAGESAEDLTQIGVIGLIKAIKRFDFSYNTKFSTYAVYIINGELQRHFRDDGIIKVSRRLKNIHIKIKREQNRLSCISDEPISLYEIAKNINEEYEDVCLAINACMEPEYLQAKAFSDENNDKLKQDVVPEDEDRTDKIIELIDLKNSLQSLEKEKRQIIVLRYIKNMTQSEVAKLMGVSQVQISRVEKRILEEIRNKNYPE